MDAESIKKLAIIVPYRDREDNLAIYAPYMHEFMEKYHKGLEFKIFIINQTEEELFNRGKLCNIGFDIAKNEYDYFIFHDVDLLPLECDYGYNDKPTHLARRLDYHGWKPCYAENFGGVSLFNKESFIKINGFSNEYWGWGAEDDDLRARCIRQDLTPGIRSGMYKSLPHRNGEPGPGGKRTTNPHYGKNYEKWMNFREDCITVKKNMDFLSEGVNSLEYKVVDTEEFPEYKKVTVEV